MNARRLAYAGFRQLPARAQDIASIAGGLSQEMRTAHAIQVCFEPMAAFRFGRGSPPAPAGKDTTYVLDFMNSAEEILLNAIMDALAAHRTMSKQALDSERVREGLKDVLLGPAQLYEALREKAGQQSGV